MHVTCWICGRQFSDTTTCPNCLSAFLDDTEKNRNRLIKAGLLGISFSEWGSFVRDGNLKTQGEISEEEFLRRKQKNIKNTKERLRKKAENEARLAAKDPLSRRGDAYR